MIIKLLLDLLLSLLEIVFSWVNLPTFPDSFSSAITDLFYYIESGIGIVWLFIDRNIVLIVIPMVIVLDNFDKLYSMVMWILKKIPFLGVK